MNSIYSTNNLDRNTRIINNTYIRNHNVFPEEGMNQDNRIMTWDNENLNAEDYDSDQFDEDESYSWVSKIQK
jgi:hypothetical protein